MRRCLTYIVLFALVCSLGIQANGATAAQNVSGYATVSNDGSCQMTLTVTLRLDQGVEDLKFPLPGNAKNVTVNGSRARGRVENGLRQVNLSGIVGRSAGVFTLHFTYTLPNLVHTNEVGLLELELPLLAGFPYPIEALEFSVTLPGPITAKPAFSSGYHQANIEKDIFCTVSGATVTGVAQVDLKDHETLSMRLTVSEEMFPQTRIVAPNFETVKGLITLFVILALLYWLIFLRNLPPLFRSRATPPEGFSAGEMGSILHLRGGDLSMMVFSWAQLGYLRIYLSHNGKVLLRRQMNMGNERSAFEQRCFRLLFGSTGNVDTGSLRYVAACRSVQLLKPNLASLVHPRSGNLLVFRGIAAAAGLFGGVCIGIGLGSGAALQWFLVVLLGAFALLSSWCIQSWAAALLAPEKEPVWLALGLCGAWLLLGAAAGLFPVGIGLAAFQLLAGLLAAFGGRRTAAGRQLSGDTLGLYRYFRTVSPAQLQAICQTNPDYYHQMAPYAMALGADVAFAKRFGKLPIGACPYISIGTESTMRATQWCGLMRRVLKAMNTRRQRRPLERLMEIIQSFRR